MDEDDPLVALRNARSRFIAGFHGQCDSLEKLTVAAAAAAAAPRRATARNLAHRLVGLAGTVGFKTVSTRAAELESLLGTSGPYDPALGHDLARRLREAFTNELASPPEWALETPTPASPLTILLVEDDGEQRAVIGAHLRTAGHVVQELSAGDQVLDHVRAPTGRRWCFSTSGCRASTASPCVASSRRTLIFPAFPSSFLRRATPWTIE